MCIFYRDALLGTTVAIILLLLSGPTFAAKAYDGHIQCEGKDCKVDLFLIRGFRAFSQCQVCHGIDGNGSTIAPSLLQKLQEIDHDTFVDRVTNGFKGQIGVMPAWKTNPNVMKYVSNLYAYLLARSDKMIHAGRLQRFDRGDKSSTPPQQSTTSTSSAGVASSGGNATPAQALPSSQGVFGSRGNLQKSR